MAWHSSLWLHISYFTGISILGFLILKETKLKVPSARPRDIDFFFTSVSAATVSSMSTVEMEVFSNPQLVTLTILMFLGGEVFTSMVGLQLKNRQQQRVMHRSRVDVVSRQIELVSIESGEAMSRSQLEGYNHLRYEATKNLVYIVMAYLLVLQVGGSLSVLLYLKLVSSARDLLRMKGLNALTFSVFTIVSSFTNCGFIPTNENMLVLKKNSGLLLLIIPQILLGNTLFPSCLRFTIWSLKKLTKRIEMDYLLENSRKIGYYHLAPSLHSFLLVFTVVGFVVIQFIVISSMEWHNSDVFGDMNTYQKLVSSLFISVNARHAGESTANLSSLAPAILVLLVVMMYLPPYTTFIPLNDERSTSLNVTDDKYLGVAKNVMMSQVSYLAIVIILICITEREKLKEDPRNFNAFNIAVEVVRPWNWAERRNTQRGIGCRNSATVCGSVEFSANIPVHVSAYGNVGFSTGYSCALQVKPDGTCKDAWYGFAGRWSSQGKFLLIVVMFFGRLKKFGMRGGEAWKLG